MSESKGFILKAEQYNQEEWCEMFRRVSETCKDLRTENECLQNQLQQKENRIKEVREDLDKQITSCTIEADGTTNDKYCRIAIRYLKHLKQILDKEVN